jgi:ubiquinone/menaquinone biosynthesis C-methylase UbiE
MATDPNTVKAYNKGAKAYDQHVSDPTDSIFHSYYEKPAIRAALPDLKGLSVISIGCGSGVDARWLADNGAAKVVGVDISSGLIDIAKQKHPALEFQVMDMEKLDFPDESFDLAYSSLAIHYVDDWTTALQEARRVLKPGGLYVFSCGHPIDSAMEYSSSDEKTNRAFVGRTVARDTKKRTVYGDYLAASGNGTKVVTGVLASVDVRVFHRTFSVMLQQIQASGFHIERMVEPQPTKQMKKADPGVYEQLTRIPSFMIWVLRK